MSWTCQLIEVVGTRQVRYDPPQCGIAGKTLLLTADGQAHDFMDLPIGSMFAIPEHPVQEGEHQDYPWPWRLHQHLSEFYFRDNKHRRPLLVVLPGHHLFCVDGPCWKGGQLYGGWRVTGDAPRITVTPSIDLVGFYHGHLRDGVITDDCEGRRFSANGDPL